MSDEIHPAPSIFSERQLAVDPILRFFHYSHLPAALQDVSSRFCDLAEFIVGYVPRNAERTVALRKLLEAKDAAVRANVPIPGDETCETNPLPGDETCETNPLPGVADDPAQAQLSRRLSVGAHTVEREQTFYDRLFSEREQLRQRLDKLCHFLVCYDFDMLPAQQKALLREQRSAMQHYYDVLGKRVAALAEHGQSEPTASVEQVDENVRVTGGGKSEDPLPFRD